MKSVTFSITGILFSFAGILSAQIPWQYKEIDNSRAKWGDFDQPAWLRYFGLDAADINKDGYLDIVSGRYFYLNPGGDMMDNWDRYDLGFNADGCLLLDIDNDDFADIIAMRYPEVLWLEAEDMHGSSWKARHITSVPKTHHVNGQGYLKADLIPGGKPEILLTAGDGIYCISIAIQNSNPVFTTSKIIESFSDEGIEIADMNGDGYPDVIFSNAYTNDSKEEPVILQWAKNPGTLDALWENQTIGITTYAIDRIKVADLNGDKILDIVVTEERYPGKEPDASLYWFEGYYVENSLEWKKHILITQYSMNNLDVGDINLDGYLDIVTSEHKGAQLNTQVWLNNGKGEFTLHPVDTGKEIHLGARLFDLDSDGDLDIIGHAWDNEKFLHLWRNDLKKHPNTWKQLSSTKGDFDIPNPGNQQTSSGILDMDKDGIQDIFITERTKAPSVVAYKFEKGKWNKYIVENEALRIEAGFTSVDVDGDGDQDILFGGDGGNKQVWWWENPYPKFDPKKPWTRHTIKKSGKNKHHDMIADDITGDGIPELIFWNQGSGSLYMAPIPKNPAEMDEWPLQTIYKYYTDSEMIQQGAKGYPGWKKTNEHEGLFAIDIDGDGIKDLLGGGRWFKYNSDGTFTENIIDAGYTFTRVVAGDFIEGGRPEVFLVAGDGHAPLLMYEYVKGTWLPNVIIEKVIDGHTLDVLDFNKDGHLDLFLGEMRVNSGNPQSKIKILLGNGKGNFIHQTIATGIGIHEGRIADLDGDGDYDILVKPYNWDAPRLDIFINKN